MNHGARMIILAAGGVGVIAAAVLIAFSGPKGVGKSGGAFNICLTAPLFETNAANGDCFNREALAELRDAPVIGGDGDTVTVTMQLEDSSEEAKAATCRAYNRARIAGGFAMTGRDMRRELYFHRACGALDQLLKATPAHADHFPPQGPDADDIRALNVNDFMRFGESSAAVAPENIVKEENGAWRISTASVEATLQPIAKADFDGDGIAEWLVFIASSPAGGSAAVGALALVEKDAAGQGVRLTPISRPRVIGAAPAHN